LQTNVTENSRDKQERTIATFGAEETERKRKSQNKNKNEQHRHNQTPMMIPCIYKIQFLSLQISCVDVTTTNVYVNESIQQRLKL
jgi:hypothetical protein